MGSCPLSISFCRSIAQYHKRSSAVNGSAPHEYEREFIEKLNACQYDQMTVLDQSDQRISINVVTVVIITETISKPHTAVSWEERNLSFTKSRPCNKM